jgi:hypothetical protein
VLWVNAFNHFKTLRWFDRFYAVHSCGVLALVILRDPPHCYQSGCPGFRQQFLEFVDCLCVATLFGFEDAFLYAINLLRQLAPRQLVPPFTLRVKQWLVPGCLRLCHTTHSSSFPIIVPMSAYPAAFLLAFACFSNPSLKCIGWHLLAVSTTSKSFLESYPVPTIRFPLP